MRGAGASQTLSANGGTGLVSLAVRLPRRFDVLPGVPASKVFKFQVTLLVTTDSAPRVTLALLEATGAAEARASALGADAQLLLVSEPSNAIGNVLRVGNLRIGTGTNLLAVNQGSSNPPDTDSGRSNSVHLEPDLLHRLNR